MTTATPRRLVNSVYRADPAGFGRLLCRMMESGVTVVVDGKRVRLEGPNDVLPDLAREARPFKRSLWQVFRDGPAPSQLPGVH